MGIRTFNVSVISKGLSWVSGVGSLGLCLCPAIVCMFMHFVISVSAGVILTLVYFS
jgi:hypothetical protein